MTEDMKYEDQSGYQGARKIGLQEALNADQGDESLEKWKKALISQGSNVTKNDKHVVFDKLLIKLPALNDKILSFTFDDVKAAAQDKKPLFTIKAGEDFAIGFEYRVFNDIVMGLRVVMKVQKLLITIARDQYMMGCYAPQEEPHRYFTQVMEAPKSGVARGKYKATCVFGDDDEGDHAFGDLLFFFNIGKEWDDDGEE